VGSVGTFSFIAGASGWWWC